METTPEVAMKSWMIQAHATGLEEAGRLSAAVTQTGTSNGRDSRGTPRAVTRSALAFWLTPQSTGRTTLSAALLFAAYLLAGLRSSQLDVPWKVDEGQRITEGYFWRLLASGDLTNPDWFRAATIRSHPPVPKYVFGAAVAVAGIEPPRDLALANAYNDGAEASSMPDAFAREYLPMRRPARVVSLIFNLVTAVAVFAVLLRAQGLAVAVFSQILLFRHYLFVLALFYARSDTIQTCLTTCTVLPLLICVSSFRLTRALPAALVAGTLSALAFQTRLNGGVALIMCIAFLIAHAPWQKRTLLFVAAVVVAFAIVSVAVNPFYWAMPRADSEIESAYYEPEALPLRVTHRFILQVNDLLGLSKGVPEEWHIRSHEGRLRFAASVLSSGKAGVLTAVGFLLAVICCVRKAARPEERAIVAWAISGLVVMALWIPLSWDIYLLIIFPSTILTACLGFGILLRRMPRFAIGRYTGHR